MKRAAAALLAAAAAIAMLVAMMSRHDAHREADEHRRAALAAECAAIDAGEGAGMDMLVTLASAARPNARTAFVVGIGGGRAVKELTRRGLAVDVLERDPRKVDAARRCGAHPRAVFVGEPALLRLEGPPATTPAWDERRYDLVVASASRWALESWDLYELAVSGGVVASRWVDESPPAEDRGRGAVASFVMPAGNGRYDHLLLHGLHGRGPLDMSAAIPLGMWPVENGFRIRETHADGTREIDAAGYVLELPDGDLVLEVPHFGLYGHGPTRVRIPRGPVEQALRARIAGVKFIPIEKAHLFDGALPNILDTDDPRQMLSSPLIAVLRGRGRLRSWAPIVHAYAPEGGRLYEIIDPTELCVIDEPQWRSVWAEHSSALRSAARAFDYGPEDEGLAALREARRILASRFGEAAELFEIYRFTARVTAAVEMAVATNDPMAWGAIFQREELLSPRGRRAAGAAETAMYEALHRRAMSKVLLAMSSLREPDDNLGAEAVRLVRMSRESPKHRLAALVQARSWLERYVVSADLENLDAPPADSQ